MNMNIMFVNSDLSGALSFSGQKIAP